MAKFIGMKVFLKVFFKSCMLFFSTRCELKIKKTVPVKGRFLVIDNALATLVYSVIYWIG